MKVWALWHGGASYAHPEMSDAEEFPSIEAAKGEFWARRYWPPRTGSPDTPNVDDTATMFLYAADPNETHDPLPEKRFSFGPRGGVRVESFW